MPTDKCVMIAAGCPVRSVLLAQAEVAGVHPAEFATMTVLEFQRRVAAGRAR
jgi:hypothetical protein